MEKGKRYRMGEIEFNTLKWMSKFKFVDLDQLVKKFKTGKTTIWDRMKKFTELGLVTKTSKWVGRTDYFVTSRASREYGLPHGYVSYAYNHDKQLVDLAIMLEEAGYEVITDREVMTYGYSDEQMKDLIITLPELTSGRKKLNKANRYPDIIALKDGHYTAWEIELSSKDSIRKQQLIKGYERCRGYDKFYIIVGNKFIANEYQKIMTEYRAEKTFLITVNQIQETINHG